MAEEQKSKSGGTVRAIVDYGALVAWLGSFLVYWLVLKIPRSDALLQATWWLIGGSAVSLAVGLIFERRLAPVPLFAGVLALSLGGLALFFHDTRFIKIKPTVANLVFAGVCLGGVKMGKNPLKAMFGGSLNLSEAAWRKLTIRYGVFFLIMAVLNEAVWRTQPDQVWALFKFPGMEALILMFAVSQTPMMMKDMKAMEAAGELEL